jgi:hypothetical protein
MGTNAQFGNTFTDPANPDHDRGRCNQDRTHLANVTAGVVTPEFGNPLLRALVSDWRVSGIVTMSSGSWLTVTTGQDTAFSGISSQRVNQVSDDVYGDIERDAEGRILHYLNRAAFEMPAPGTLGNHQINSIRGPGNWNGIDLALSKLFSFADGQNVELRLEAFNVVNSWNWGSPNTNLSSGQFGRISGESGNPRIMQFGIKYGF